MDDQTKNMLLAIALSLAVFIGWYAIFPPPTPPRPVTPEASQPATAPTAPVLPADPAQLRAEALTKTERVTVDTPSLSGSISVRGGRIDDLHLRNYLETLDPDSPTVTLLSPMGSDRQTYFATFGWLPAAAGIAAPDPNTDWQVEGNRTLTATTPVTLVWDNGAGLMFRRVLSVDAQYMFTVAETVENRSAAAVTLSPYAYIARRGEPVTSGQWILHEGAVAAFDGALKETDFSTMADTEDSPTPGMRVETVKVAQSGWVGFTDKYWLTALVPEAGQPFDAVYRYTDDPALPEYRTEITYPPLTVAPGASAEIKTRLFAGAKEVKTLQVYRDTQNIAQFDDAVDWGWFFFFTKLIFEMLHWLKGLVGNMGVAIILLTFIFKTVLFPLAWKSFVSMSKMKKLQPEMERIKQEAGDDKKKLQMEMMELYKTQKVNPAAGCLPILVQIPIFFSLYKVLFVTIEMRHAPFYGWIRDLSAPDPTSILNLFGLLPFAAPDPTSLFGILSIGVYPVIMGFTMWMQQKLNPAPPDPTQAAIFNWMPWIFMFMMGTFSSGLVIYWCVNNTLTFIQQYAIMRSQGVDVDFFGNVRKTFARKKKDA